MPPELQQRVHEEVKRTKERSGWPAGKTVAALGVPRTTYYRWLREEAWAKAQPAEPPKPVQPYEALPEEKAAVKEYALKHPELRHRELAWRMVDEDVAYLGMSTVYRILREAKLVCPWRRRSKRRREEDEKATRPDEIWATDLKYVWVGERNYFLVCFLDEYSRYIVHHELLWGMDGKTVSVEAQAALETLPKDGSGATSGEAEDPLGQRELLHFSGVRCGIGRARAEPETDQAPLPGREWNDGTCQPDDR